MNVEKEYEKLGLKASEFNKICEYLGRKPNYLELSIYSVMWSEHCSYKSSRALLKKFKTTGKYVIQGPGENAGVLDIGDGQAIVMKIESHNHPSAVEPYQGAATGIGGIIRDIFAMGARPICSLNSLRFGKLDSNPRQKYLFENVVKGIGDYGNCMGIPTVGGEVYFDKIYEGNPLVNAMSVGIIEEGKILIKSRAFGEGNLLVLIGSSTGRDGIHGATFASDELDEKSEERRPSVQVGDPFAEKVLLEVCLELLDKRLILGLQDMGAAGITSSSIEMASKGDVGIDIDVGLVPLREPSMVPYEIMISESQERMLALVKPVQYDDVKEVCRKWNINCQYIGKVTSTANIRIYNKDILEGEIPIKTLTELSPVYHHRFEEPKYIKKIINDGISDNEIKQITDRYSLNEIFIKMIGSPNICSKKWVWEQYDHMVQTNTVILPGQDSAVLRIKGKNKAIAFTSDGNGRYCYLDPYTGGAIAVAESARNLVCVGAIPIGITDCLNFGTPEKPEIFWQFKNSVEGMNKACKVLDIPIISGNVSFYNESFGNPIYPTPVSATAGLITKLDYITTMGFKSEGDAIILLGASKVEMGGSEFMEVFLERVGGKCPSLNLETEKRLQQLCLSLITGGFVKSAHDCSAGGLGISLLKCCIYGNIGADIKLDLLDGSLIKTLFSESQSRIVITIDKASTSKLEEECRNYKIQFSLLGRVQGRLLKINNVLCADIEEASDVYSHAIEIKMSL
jgi:phosphoribosylformylglycinamidine synthase subunit PurL